MKGCKVDHSPTTLDKRSGGLKLSPPLLLSNLSFRSIDQQHLQLRHLR